MAEEISREQQKDIVRQRQIEIAKSMKVKPDILDILNKVWNEPPFRALSNILIFLRGFPLEEYQAPYQFRILKRQKQFFGLEQLSRQRA